MAVSRVRVSEFVTAGKKYVSSQIKKANADNSRYLTIREGSALRSDLKDNLQAFRASHRTVSAKAFEKQLHTELEVWANHAAGGDGYLDLREAKGLPKELRDNFQAYVKATAQKGPPVVKVGDLETHDLTPKGLVEKHHKQYGKPKVSYARAFSKALKEAFIAQEGGPRWELSEGGGPDGEPLSKKKVDALMKKMLSEGGLRLLSPKEGDETPIGTSSQDEWVFAIDGDTPGDHGYWVVVNKTSGETYANSFN
jgi:hypothetical protein